MKRPFVAAAGLALICSFILLYCSKTICLVLGICLLLIFVVLLIARRRVSSFIGHMLVLFCAAIVLCCGVWIQKIQIEPINKLHEQNVEFGGVIIERIDSTSAVVRAENGDLPSGCKILIDDANLDVGDKVYLKGLLSVAFSDYKGYYYSDGIYGRVTPNTTKINGISNELSVVLTNLRTEICNRIDTYLSTDSAALVKALSIGDRVSFTNEFSNQIRVAGVSHLTVVSGLHLGIICGAFYWLLRRFLKCNVKLTSILCSILVLFVVAVCGFGVSIIRASIVYLLMLLSMLIGRRSDPLNSLGAAVVLILCFSPFAVGSVSFLLSVAATAGLLVISVRLSNAVGADRIKQPVLRKTVVFITDSVCISISTCIATLPVVVYFFEAVSLWSILSNLLLSYPVSFVLIMSLIGVVLYPIKPVAESVFAIVEPITEFCVNIIKKIGSLESGMIYVDSRLVWLICGVVVLIICFVICFPERKNKKKGAID